MSVALGAARFGINCDFIKSRKLGKTYAFALTERLSWLKEHHQVPTNKAFLRANQYTGEDDNWANFVLFFHCFLLGRYIFSLGRDCFLLVHHQIYIM